MEAKDGRDSGGSVCIGVIILTKKYKGGTLAFTSDSSQLQNVLLTTGARER